MSEILINKKIVHIAEHVTKMTITQADTTEETITYLILDMEERNKDKTKTKVRPIQQSDNLSTSKQKPFNE